MSDDLISKSALLKEIENMKVPYGNDNESYISMARVLDIISEQSTAYDVDEKCEKLKSAKKDCKNTNTIFDLNEYVLLDDAIDIVKGGVEND